MILTIGSLLLALELLKLYKVENYRSTKWTNKVNINITVEIKLTFLSSLIPWHFDHQLLSLGQTLKINSPCNAIQPNGFKEVHFVFPFFLNEILIYGRNGK